MLQIIVIPEQLRYQPVKAGVDLSKPAAVVNAVGNMGEAVGLQVGDIAEQVVAKNLAVQAGNAVDHAAGREAQVCHVYLTVTDNQVASDTAVPAEGLHQIVAPALVDLAHDFPEAGQQRLD